MISESKQLLKYTTNKNRIAVKLVRTEQVLDMDVLAV